MPQTILRSSLQTQRSCRSLDTRDEEEMQNEMELQSLRMFHEEDEIALEVEILDAEGVELLRGM